MKTIKSILVAVVLLVGTVVSATPVEVDKKKPVTVTQEISQLLENPTFVVPQDIKAFATVVVNEAGELVVLCVTTENKMVERFVKSRLNYKKLVNKLEKGREYKVPITIVSA